MIKARQSTQSICVSDIKPFSANIDKSQKRRIPLSKFLGPTGECRCCRQRHGRTPLGDLFLRRQQTGSMHQVKKILLSMLRDVAVHCKQNPKAFWKYINSKRTTKTGIGDLQIVDISGNSTTLRLESWSLMNKLF